MTQNLIAKSIKIIMVSAVTDICICIYYINSNIYSILRLHKIDDIHTLHPYFVITV